jgi:hypothetical protein
VHQEHHTAPAYASHQLEKYCTFKTMSCQNPKICKMSKGVSKPILKFPHKAIIRTRKCGNSFISLPFAHNDLSESPVDLVSCRQAQRPCSIKFLFCQSSGSLRRRTPFEQSRFSNSQCEEVVHRVFVLGPCFKSSESNKEVCPGSIEAFLLRSSVLLSQT